MCSDHAIKGSSVRECPTTAGQVEHVDACSLHEVTFAYGQTPLFADFQLTLPGNAFVAIAGPNGCGKSTLLHLLCGILRPRSGSIRVMGQDINTLSRREVSRMVALVPQNFFVNFPYTVREVVMMGRHPYRGRFGRATQTDHAAVANAIDSMGLASLVGKPVTQLSGGERQRVIVARALAQDTPLILLDEATSNLDVRHALDILHHLRERVRSSPKTVIAVMHGLNLAAQFADYLVLMQDGGVADQGPVSRVFTGQRLQEVFGVRSHIHATGKDGRPYAVFERGEGR